MSVVEGAAHLFVGFLLLVQDVLEAANLLLHVRVDLQVARNYALHFVHVLVNVAFFLAVGVLQCRDQLTFLRQ